MQLSIIMTSLAAGSLLGLLSGLLLYRSARRQLSPLLGLTTILRFALLGGIIYYLLLSTPINLILLLGAFLIAFWLVIIRVVT